MTMKLNDYFSGYSFQTTLAASSLALASVMLLGTSSASAAIIASDSFAVGVTNGYNAGSVTNQNPSVGTSGFTGNWGASMASTGDIIAEVGGLSAALVKDATSAGQLSHQGGSARSNFHQITSLPTSSTYFFSFLLNSTVGSAAQFGLSTQGSAQVAPLTEGVRVGVSGSNIQLFVDNTPTTLLANYTAGTTYFVLVDIANVAGTGTDTVGARIFSSTATNLTSPLGTATPITNADISSDLGYLSLSKTATSGTGMDVDEFRFGTELNDVVVPEPSTVALLIGGLGLVTLIRRREV